MSRQHTFKMWRCNVKELCFWTSRVALVPGRAPPLVNGNAGTGLLTSDLRRREHVTHPHDLCQYFPNSFISLTASMGSGHSVEARGRPGDGGSARASVKEGAAHPSAMPTPRDPLMDMHFLPLAWESSLGVKLALSVPPSPVTGQQTARAITSIAAAGTKDKSPARKKVHRSRVDLKTLLQKSEPLETGPETPRIKTCEEPCELEEALGADLGAIKETPVRPRRHPKETVWSPLPLLKLAAQAEAPAAQKKELVEWGSPIAPQRRLERQQTAERSAFDRQWERAAELHEQPPDQSLFYYAYCLDKV